MSHMIIQWRLTVFPLESCEGRRLQMPRTATTVRAGAKHIDAISLGPMTRAARVRSAAYEPALSITKVLVVGQPVQISSLDYLVAYAFYARILLTRVI